jgi:hypothetical protein
VGRAGSHTTVVGGPSTTADSLPEQACWLQGQLCRCIGAANPTAVLIDWAQQYQCIACGTHTHATAVVSSLGCGKPCCPLSHTQSLHLLPDPLQLRTPATYAPRGRSVSTPRRRSAHAAPRMLCVRKVSSSLQKASGPAQSAPTKSTGRATLSRLLCPLMRLLAYSSHTLVTLLPTPKRPVTSTAVHLASTTMCAHIVCRAVLCRAVPCRVVSCRAVQVPVPSCMRANPQRIPAAADQQYLHQLRFHGRAVCRGA